jgi:hypothetical protein
MRAMILVFWQSVAALSNQAILTASTARRGPAGVKGSGVGSGDPQ